jgi:hypothetical protein
MSHNKKRTDTKDRTTININQPYEVQYWSEKFNVTPDELRDAIERAGSEVKEIERTLNQINSNSDNYGR